MAKNGVVRISDDVKKNAEIVLKEIGISVSTAIEVFLIQVIRSKKIPFDIEIDFAPIQKTIETIEDMEQNDNVYGSFSSVNQLMENLNA